MTMETSQHATALIGSTRHWKRASISDQAGSEMTSRIFGVVKTAFQKLAKGDTVLRYCVNAFTVPNQKTLVIYRHRSQIMYALFGRQGTNSLAIMRYNTFSKKVVFIFVGHSYNQVMV